MKLVLEWIKAQGGLAGVEKVNRAKKDLLYGAMDAAPDFYKGAADKSGRSWMNVTMRLPTEELENKFISDAKKAGLLGLKGHRSVGGLRASIYNAFPEDGIDALVAFMREFEKKNG